MRLSPLRSLPLLAAGLLAGCPDDDTTTKINPSGPASDAAPDTASEPTDTASPTGPATDTTSPTGPTTDATGTTATADDTGCTPESDAGLCQAGKAQCGELTREDACGEPRTVDCGACPDAQSCQDNRCAPIDECVDAALGECCNLESGAVSSCALNACGVFWSSECIADDCVEELTQYSDCLTFECPALAACGTCSAFCAQVLTAGCGQGETWAACMKTCADAGENLQIGCGIGLSCEYNGACTEVPASICPNGGWRCREAAECIPKAAVCDQHSDCVEASDEAQPGCDSPQCAAGSRLCAGACAACPAGMGPETFVCVAGACEVGSCAEGYLPCPDGCCTEHTVVVAGKGSAVNVLVGKDGAIHLAYHSGGQTYYLRGTPDAKKWSGKAVLHAGATDPEISLDAAEKVYVVLSPAFKQHSLATNKSGAWVVQPMPNATDFLDVAVGPDGRPYARSYAAGNIFTLWRREDDATSWKNLGQIPGFGPCSTLASRPGGIEVVCADVSYKDLVLYTYNAGDWSTKPALAGGAGIEARRLVVDGLGELELAYNLNGKLNLARSEKGVWTTEQVPVPAGDTGNPVRLAVRDPARPYIRTYSDLFGIRAPGGWSFTAIDLADPDIGVLLSNNSITCGTAADDSLVCRSAG